MAVIVLILEEALSSFEVNKYNHYSVVIIKVVKAQVLRKFVLNNYISTLERTYIK